MARKDKPEAEAEAEVGDQSSTPEVSEEEMAGGPPIDTDFDLEDEYKVEPLIPNGNYRGNVVGVAFEPQDHAIAWKVTLADNGGVMSDGETSIDGWSGYYRNWLPKPGDENIMTKDNRQTKRQSKINMMKVFADKMKINMNKPAIIAESIRNQDWVGIPVIAAVGLHEWEGITRNQINRMVQAEEAPMEE